MLLGLGPFLQGAAAPVIVGNAIESDGAGNYVARTTALTGGVANKFGTISLWYRFTSIPAGTKTTFFTGGFTSSGSGMIEVQWTTAKKLFFRVRQIGSGADAVLLTCVNQVPDLNWHHILMSWHQTSQIGQFYHDDVDVLESKVLSTTLNSAWDVPLIYISRRPPGAPNDTSEVGSCIGELFMHSQHLDISVAANRRKFINADGTPADLGADGSTPLGVQPLVYLSGDKDNFPTNKGSGGNFTWSGTPASSTTSPALTTTSFAPDGVTVTGSTTGEVHRTSGLVGAPAGQKVGTISLWFKLAATTLANNFFLTNYLGGDGMIEVRRDSANGRIAVQVRPTGSGADTTWFHSNAFAITDTDWHHVVCSWDNGNNKHHLYIDDVSRLLVANNSTTLTAAWDSTEPMRIGRRGTLNSGTGFSVAEVWAHPVYHDLAIEGHRRKFLRSDGTPADMGSDGSATTDVVPLIYLSGDQTEFVLNKGTGGAFQWTGTPASETTTPKALVFPTAALWYDASNAGEITLVSSRVSQWNDRSGEGRHATQATAGSRPYFDTTINGKTAMRFASTYLEGPTTLTYDRTNFHIFAVIQPTGTPSAPEDFFARFQGSGSGREIIVRRNTTNTVSFFAYSDPFNSASGVNVSSTTTLVPGNTYLVEAGYHSGNLEVWIDGTQEATTALSGVGTITYNTIIGALTTTGADPFNGSIGEIIMTSGETDPEPIRTYLAAKWGISLA